MKQRKFGGMLGDIVRGMNECYQAAAVPINLTCCVFYLILGVFLVAGVLLLVAMTM